ncbi:hypothetical protein SRHO_G00106360 [Serrasalmus rhombeus]
MVIIRRTSLKHMLLTRSYHSADCDSNHSLKNSLSEKTLEAFRTARRKVQRTARRCTNEHWQELSHDIQNTAATGNIRGMYVGIKKVLGPTQSKTAPLKTSSGKVITDKAKQMERWVEHYSELYSRENIVVKSALDAIDPLPTMEELDAETTWEELSKAIDSLACGKASGNDGIPPRPDQALQDHPFAASTWHSLPVLE